MAAIFDLALVAGRNDDIIARVASAGLEAIDRLTPNQPRNNITSTIGAIVSAAGFPEVGIPIAVGGHLLRWLTKTGSQAGARV
jgi:hypothetical protein